MLVPNRWQPYDRPPSNPIALTSSSPVRVPPTPASLVAFPPLGRPHNVPVTAADGSNRRIMPLPLRAPPPPLRPLATPSRPATGPLVTPGIDRGSYQTCASIALVQVLCRSRHVQELLKKAGMGGSVIGQGLTSVFQDLLKKERTVSIKQLVYELDATPHLSRTEQQDAAEVLNAMGLGSSIGDVSQEDFYSLPVRPLELLSDAVGEFGQTGDFACPDCHSETATSATLLPVSPPPVLALQRQIYDPITKYKRDDPLSRIEKAIVVEGIKYDFVGVVLHQGPSLDSGHYVAAVPGSDGFLLYDDSNCTAVDNISGRHGTAYLVIYNRDDHSPPSAALATAAGTSAASQSKRPPVKSTLDSSSLSMKGHDGAKENEYQARVEPRSFSSVAPSPRRPLAASSASNHPSSDLPTLADVVARRSRPPKVPPTPSDSSAASFDTPKPQAKPKAEAKAKPFVTTSTLKPSRQNARPPSSSVKTRSAPSAQPSTSASTAHGRRINRQPVQSRPIQSLPTSRGISGAKMPEPRFIAPQVRRATSSATDPSKTAPAQPRPRASSPSTSPIAQRAAPSLNAITTALLEEVEALIDQGLTVAPFDPVDADTDVDYFWRVLSNDAPQDADFRREELLAMCEGDEVLRELLAEMGDGSSERYLWLRTGCARTPVANWGKQSWADESSIEGLTERIVAGKCTFLVCLGITTLGVNFHSLVQLFSRLPPRATVIFVRHECTVESRTLRVQPQEVLPFLRLFSAAFEGDERIQVEGRVTFAKIADVASSFAEYEGVAQRVRQATTDSGLADMGEYMLALVRSLGRRVVQTLSIGVDLEDRHRQVRLPSDFKAAERLRWTSQDQERQRNMLERLNTDRAPAYERTTGLFGTQGVLKPFCANCKSVNAETVYEIPKGFSHRLCKNCRNGALKGSRGEWDEYLRAQRKQRHALMCVNPRCDNPTGEGTSMQVHRHDAGVRCSPCHEFFDNHIGYERNPTGICDACGATDIARNSSYFREGRLLCQWCGYFEKHAGHPYDIDKDNVTCEYTLGKCLITRFTVPPGTLWMLLGPDVGIGAEWQQRSRHLQLCQRHYVELSYRQGPLPVQCVDCGGKLEGDLPTAARGGSWCMITTKDGVAVQVCAQHRSRAWQNTTANLGYIPSPHEIPTATKTKVVRARPDSDDSDKDSDEEPNAKKPKRTKTATPNSTSSSTPSGNKRPVIEFDSEVEPNSPPKKKTLRGRFRDSLQDAGLIGSSVIPSTFDPAVLVHATYPTFGNVQPGETYSVESTQVEPSVSFNAPEGKDSKFTLVLADPDAPSREDPKWSPFRHWTLANVVPNQAAGETLTTYLGPAPPAGTGPHRYVFLVYKQPVDHTPELGVDGDERPSYDLASFVRKNELELVGANFFLAESK
ncbi:hypothetical protein JCM11641_002410 [Rhodosporidiobolus odoratus]